MPTLFPTFAPKAIGMVGRKLPAATLSRCIIVELRRRKATERIERFEHKDDAGLGELRSRLLRWSIDNEDVLRDAKPHMPDTFDNRRADNWRLLFAIADLAGGEWGDKARAAASNIERASDTSSIGVRLLAHIKRIFDELGCDVILSAVLVAKLKEDTEQPWAEWNNGKGLTQNSLAVLLGGGGGRGRGSRGGYGIRSQNVLPATVRARQGLQAVPVRGCLGEVSDRRNSLLLRRGGSIGRPSVQMPMALGQPARIGRRAVSATAYSWHLSHSRNGLHVCTVYWGEKEAAL